MDSAALFDAYAWPDRCLRVNFVTTVSGATTGADHRSGSINTIEDLNLFRALRAGCDAVLVGAGTARAERYGPVRVHPDWRRFRTGPDPELIVVSRSGQVDIPGARIIDEDGIAEVVATYPKVLCEGGSGLLSTLLDRGLVDQFALTVAPHIGGNGRLLPDGPARPARLRHLHADGDTVFTLWDLR